MSATTTPQWKWEDWFLVALMKKIIPTVLPAKVVYMPEEPLQPHCKERGKNTVREKRRNELKRFGVFKNFNECTSSYVLHMIRCICKTSDKTQLLNHFHQDKDIFSLLCTTGKVAEVFGKSMLGLLFKACIPYTEYSCRSKSLRYCY